VSAGSRRAEPWLAIFNPASGNDRRRAQWQSVGRVLRTAGIRIDVVETAGPRHGATIARDAVVAGRRRILIAGGDGSAHDVVNGVMQTGERARDVTLALAPLGTGNDWARTLGMPRDPARLAAALASGVEQPHDVGLIEFTAEPHRPRCWFVNVAGAGYDAFVLSRLPTRVRSRLRYLCGAVTGLRAYRPPRFRVRTAGRDFEERLWVTFVANGRYCGGGMQVAPHARIDDGKLDVVAIEALESLRILAKLSKLYRGTIASDPAVRAFASERLGLDAAPAAAVEADGQVVGTTPVEFSVVHGALRVIVAGPS
jgi:YegS/Rv2252/BmrU family lipid kinase